MHSVERLLIRHTPRAWGPMGEVTAELEEKTMETNGLCSL